MGAHQFDVVGDVHGHLDALRALGAVLGYDVDRGWTHRDGRVLLFVGDLVDRGPASLEVVELVRELVARDRAVCLMGNHEYNLVAWRRSVMTAKASNRPTIADVERRAERWAAAFEFLASLPIAIELEDLRVVHAAWHADCVARLRAVLAPTRTLDRTTTAAWLRAHVVLRAPFDAGGLVRGLPDGTGGDPAHVVLMKGYEEPVAAPFEDVDGKLREQTRVAWWLAPRAEIPSDRTIAFGHYWSVPPTEGELAFAPPHPSGHHALRTWQRERGVLVAATGEVALPAGARFVCVDYNGVTVGTTARCIGALRWPERRVAWALVR